jgi:hypothetical protein
MIVIPMMGRSSRFLDAGYLSPKYQLLVNNKSLFELAVNSFSPYFDTEHFLFIVRSDYDNRRFVSEQIINLGIKDYRVLVLDGETRGQADTVFRGTKIYDPDISMTIFNIDTIRLEFKLPEPDEMFDGLLEVFMADGDGWSFVEPTENNLVARTAEKKRISNLCSNGLYVFKELGDFRDAFVDAVQNRKYVNGELYVAPLYNFLIKNGKKIRYRLINNDSIETCGTPTEFEAYKKKHEHL